MNGDTRKLEELLKRVGLLESKVGLADRLPQTTLGFQLGTELHALGHVPTARVYNSANISIAHASDVVLTFNSEWWDNDNFHSTTTNPGRLTAQVTGIYLVTASIEWDIEAGGIRTLWLEKSGTVPIAATKITTTGGLDYQSIATVVNLDFSDYMRVKVHQTNTATDPILVKRTSAASPEFSIVKVAEIGQL